VSQGNNFGIGMITATDTDNTIQDNEVVGNTNGIFLAAGVQGNTITGNTIIGNPPMQVDVDHSSNPGYDIKNMATAGANTITGNLCVTSLNAPCATAPSAPTGSGTENLLEASVCGTGINIRACRETTSVWNAHLTKISPAAKPLENADDTELITAHEYILLRGMAGIDSAGKEKLR